MPRTDRTTTTADGLRDISGDALDPARLRVGALRALGFVLAMDYSGIRVDIVGESSPPRHTASEWMALQLAAGANPHMVLSTMWNGLGCPPDAVLAGLVKLAAGAQPGTSRARRRR